jgi:uncharacterized protein
MNIAGRSVLVLLSMALLVGCGGSAPPPVPTATAEPVSEADTGPTSINQYLSMAAAAPSPQAEAYMLRASALALENSDSDNAAAIMAGIEAAERLPLPLQVTLGLQRAEVAMLRDDPQGAITHLNGAPFERLDELDLADRLRLLSFRTAVYLAQEQYLAAAREHTRMAPLLGAAERIDNNNRIWQILSSAPTGALAAQSRLVDSYELRGWMELVNVVNNSRSNMEQQVRAVTQWQDRWNQHSAASQLPDALAFAAELLNNRPAHIALLLPLADAAGRAVSEGFMAAYYDAVNQNQQVPQVTVFDTSNVTDIMPMYRSAAEIGADMIIGPLRKDSVRQLQAQLELPVPTLALNYGDEGRLNPSGLYQFGLAPEDEIAQAARMAWAAGHRFAAVLTPAGEEYRRIQETFISSWQALGGEVVAAASFGSVATYSDIIRRMMSIDQSEARAASLRNVLPRSNIQFTPRRRQDIDFVFILANPAEGRQLKPTMAFHFAGDVPVYAMPTIYDGGASATGNRDLNGIYFLDAPWILTNTDPLKSQTYNVWSDASGPVQRLRAMGIDSFRLHTRVAQLANFPGVKVTGATGTLSMRSDGTITRELTGAQFVNGEVTLLASEPLVPGVAGRQN